jgi:hypothetical protein
MNPTVPQPQLAQEYLVSYTFAMESNALLGIGSLCYYFEADSPEILFCMAVTAARKSRSPSARCMNN